jgi:hypothetical protein
MIKEVGNDEAGKSRKEVGKENVSFYNEELRVIVNLIKEEAQLIITFNRNTLRRRNE